MTWNVCWDPKAKYFRCKMGRRHKLGTRCHFRELLDYPTYTV